MNETYILELNFETELGKSKKISIRRPVIDLTELEILPVMESIAAAEIFSDDGIDPYQSAKGARYVRRTVEDVFGE